MSTPLEDFLSEFTTKAPQLAYATAQGSTVTVPLSVVGLDGVERSREAASNQAVMDERSLQRAVDPVLARGNWRVVGTVSGAQSAVQFAPVPKTVPYLSIPVGARLLSDSAQTSRGTTVPITQWTYAVDEESQTVTLYPDGDSDRGIARVVNDLLPRGWRIVELWENRADGSVKDPVILKAPSALLIDTGGRRGVTEETEVTEGSYRQFIELDERLRAEEEN